MDNEQDLMEITLDSTTHYDGVVCHFKVDTVKLPNGNISSREYIHHRGGAAILAVDDEDYTYLVRQYRHPYREVITEIPAGKLEEGEEPLETAKRELEEEIGKKAAKIVPFGEIYPSPGYTDEHLYIFLATGLSSSHAHLDEDEFLHVQRVPFAEALRQVLSGEIHDSKTCYAILRYAGEGNHEQN